MDISSHSITVVGTGSWGTTLAISLARAGRRTTLLARTQEEAGRLRAAGQHERFAPGVPFPLSLAIESDPAVAMRGCRLVLLVVPSQTMRANAETLKPYVPSDAVVLSCAKGFEQGSLKRMSEVLAEVLPLDPAQIGALSGPNIAREILESKPATTVVATPDQTMAETAQRLLTTSHFRVYTGDDVVGIELAGALKNIIALGAGIADGLNAGDNAKAAFMTRGLSEIARLGIMLGANPLTFAGLAGLGDLVATCASPYSRNRRMGEALARGLTLETARAQLGGIAEGVTTVQTARELAAQYQVELPIADQLHAILFGGRSPQHAIVELMQREVKHELEGMRGLLGL
ncbi:MAG TPA: NAD(P)H-dependent glycerol-3-phosphate dehydrogenase [Herpetosiphonaceae bacterium]